MAGDDRQKRDVMTEHEKRLEREAEAFRQQMETRRQAEAHVAFVKGGRRPTWSGEPVPSKPKRPTGTLANFQFESDKQ